MARARYQLKSLRVPFTLFCLAALLFVSYAERAAANLFISPSRVEIGPRDRGTRVSLVNTSKKTRTYRMSWREQAQTSGGKYAVLEAGQRVRGLQKASTMIKFSPSLVTLKPGERQHIRLAIRRPGSLADGEYRSHLVFEALPEPLGVSSDENQPQGARIIVQLNMAFSIPIILRQGETSVEAGISQAEVFSHVSKKGDQSLGVRVKLVRSGAFSSVGNLKIFWTDKGAGEETQIGVLNNVTLYSETPELNIKVGLKGLSVPSDGTLRVVYEGAGAFKGTVFDEFIRPVTAGNFLPDSD